METAALLEEAARLHGQGALGEAASRYRRVLECEPEHAQALYHLAVIGCQQGRLEEGVALVGRSLAREARQPRARNLLGMALGRLGRGEEALAHFDAAIDLQPGFADAHGNRAGVLMELGRLAEAVAGFERAVALAPDSAGDWLNLGTALDRLGRHEEALAGYDRVLALQASFPPAHFNRGNVLARLARYEEALASYDRALALDRRYADALDGRAQVLLQLGRVEGAVANLQELIAMAPDRAGALDRLVQMLIARGDHARALVAVLPVLAAKDSHAARALFVRCVANRKFTADPGVGVRGYMARALAEPWDRPADLAVPAVSLVMLAPAVKDVCVQLGAAWPQRLMLEDLSGRLTAIADDALLCTLLESAPICDVALERALTGIRAIFLAAASDGPATPTEDGLLRFFCALARQCFINEYVFDANADELVGVERLRERLVRAMASGGPVPVLWLVAVAMFLPLHSLPGTATLIDQSWSPAVAALLTQQVREPLEERRLGAELVALTAIADEVSLRVKQQYEENPYPRWVKPAPAPEPKTMAQYFGGWLQPESGFGHGPAGDRVDVLVAGCGTGQNLVETARQLAGAQVLAVDLSRASLGYAKRQALALGLSNVTFAVADILALDAIGRSFDVVEASGVLHHLADPWAGWRKLIALLRPGGLMRVGLYSKLARRDVNAARAYVADRKYASSADAIRQSRQDILALPAGTPARNVAASLDFFTTSECRDLLFHVQEQQMTLPEIARFLGASDAELLGFIVDPGVMQRFQARFPQEAAIADLDLWHAFETEHPDTFAGMYQFWLRKRR